MIPRRGDAELKTSIGPYSPRKDFQTCLRLKMLPDARGLEGEMRN